MIHPDTELRHVNDQIGYGVFATKFIPRGTITWVRDEFDQVFSHDQVEKMAEPYQKILEKYSFVDGKGKIVLCWDLARFMNHSCEATCLSAGYEFEISIRDIQAGEELTDDYGTLNLEDRFLCACNTPGCRKEILPDDLLRYSETWDRRVQAVFPMLLKVKQPLWNLLKEKDEVHEVLRNMDQMRSSRFNYYPNGKSHLLNGAAIR